MGQSNLLKSIEKIAEEAGKIVLEAHGIRQTVSEKSDFRNLVTKYDKQVQEFLIRELTQILPEASFLGEEWGRDAFREEYRKGWLFVLDPIDGTSNFICGLIPSVVSIGLFKDGKPYIGVVYEPHLKQLFAAERSCGAHLNGVPIHSSELPLSMSLVTFGTSAYYDGATIKAAFDAAHSYMGKCIDIRRTGSAAYDLCSVAAGITGLYIEPYIQLWDYAAGALIAEEAGCRVTDFCGEPLSYDGPSGVAAASSGTASEEYLPKSIGKV